MKSKSILMLTLLAVSVIGLASLVFYGFGEGKRFSAQQIRQGLDLKGGVSILYEAQAERVTRPEMESALSLIRGRLDRTGNLDAEAAIEGNNRIRVDIPGVTDAESAVSDIGRTAMLTFTDEEGNVILDGRHIVNAYREARQTSQGAPVEVVVALEFNAEGQQLFEDATGRLVGQRILILLDDEIISGPTVNEKIIGGNAVISGDFTTAAGEELAALIRAGSLPFALEVIYINNVGAKLGSDALTTSITAGIAGAVIILLFMVFAYRMFGAAADWALIVYIGIVLAVLSALRVTLTLPGIAGVVLSIGMAVDANVVIFERIKEEIRSGKSLAASVESGFKRALPPILDCNVTTFIAAGVLFWLGTGPVKGFAQTLTIGVAVSMFSCLVVTRAIISGLLGVGVKKMELFVNLTKKPEDARKHIELKIVENRKKFFIASACALTLGLLVILLNGALGNGMFNYDVEFSGGLSIMVDLGQDYDTGDIERIVNDTTGQAAPQVQRIQGLNQVSVRLRQVTPEQRAALINAIRDKYGIPEDNFMISDISATVSGEMQRSAGLAILIACLAMLAYISIRFRNLKSGSGVVIAILHDALFVIGCYAVLRIPLNYSFIAVLLTVMGYAINNNIIIYDRVRENRKLNKRGEVGELIDKSVNQSLTRCAYTTLTTLIMIVALYIIGVQTIKQFSLPIILGLLCGTYTSVCNAGSFLYVLETKFGKARRA